MGVPKIIDPVDVHLGARLRLRRKELGLTQGRLAQAYNKKFEPPTTHQQVQKYEGATNRMLAIQLWRFAEILGVSLGYFYEGLDPATMLVPKPSHPAPKAAKARNEEPVPA